MYLITHCFLAIACLLNTQYVSTIQTTTLPIVPGSISMSQWTLDSANKLASGILRWKIYYGTAQETFKIQWTRVNTSTPTVPVTGYNSGSEDVSGAVDSTTISKLLFGTQYRVTITPIGCVANVKPETQVVNVPPYKPDGLTVVPSTVSAIVSWNGPDNDKAHSRPLTDYQVDVHTLFKQTVEPVVTTTSSSATLSKLEPGNTYAVYVYSRENGVLSVGGPGKLFTAKPSVPNNPSVDPLKSSTALHVKWDYTDRRNNFEVEYYPTSDTAQTKKVEGIFTNSVVLTGLIPNTEYTIKIVAVSGDVHNVATIYVSAGSYTAPKAVSDPATFTARTDNGDSDFPLTVGNNFENSQVQVSWTAVASATGYTATSNTGQGPQTPTGISASFTYDTYMTPGRLYQFNITANTNPPKMSSVLAVARPDGLVTLDYILDKTNVELKLSYGQGTIEATRMPYCVLLTPNCRRDLSLKTIPDNNFVIPGHAITGKIMNLLPRSQYSITAVTYSANVATTNTKQTSTNVITPDTAPYPVTNLMNPSSTLTAVQLTWTVQPYNIRPSIVEHVIEWQGFKYEKVSNTDKTTTDTKAIKVPYSDSNDTSVQHTVSHTIRNLKEGFYYTFSVYAVNSLGSSTKEKLSLPSMLLSSDYDRTKCNAIKTPMVTKRSLTNGSSTPMVTKRSLTNGSSFAVRHTVSVSLLSFLLNVILVLVMS